MQLYNSQQWKIPWNIQSVDKQKHVGVNEERVEREWWSNPIWWFITLEFSYSMLKNKREQENYKATEFLTAIGSWNLKNKDITII